MSLLCDGTHPAELLQIAREQLQPYSSVSLKTATAQQIERSGSAFEITSSDHSRLQARTVLLATGLRDELPVLEGIEELWGKGVFHCPYCDGYEIRGQAIAVYGADDTVLHQVMMLRNWTDKLTLCAADGWELTTSQREKLARYGIQVVEQPVAALESESGQIQALRFDDGSSLSCKALFIRPKTTHRTSFAYELGCRVNENDVVQVDLQG